jgi:hypothetical protein
VRCAAVSAKLETRRDEERQTSDTATINANQRELLAQFKSRQREGG